MECIVKNCQQNCVHDFPPKDKRKTVTTVFPCLKLNNVELKYVDEFKYLGYVKNSSDERDDKDVLLPVRFVVYLREQTFLLV